MRTQFLAALAVSASVLATASTAHAWGAYHAGYTHYGSSGVYHYGRTSAYGPYGSYSGAHASDYRYGGSVYHAGYHSYSQPTSNYLYAPTNSRSSSHFGYSYGSRYSSGVYRRY